MSTKRRVCLILAWVLVVLLAPAGNTTSHASDVFNDVSTDHVFHDDISWLAAAGITKGCNPPDNTSFCPDDPVTRGQMAAFLVRALGLEDPGTVDFIDDDASVFETDIAKLATAGITKGCNPPDNTSFCPDDPVTRGQMAAFLHRSIDYLLDSGPDPGGAQADVLPEAAGEGLTAAGDAENTNELPTGADVNPGGIVLYPGDPAVGVAQEGDRPPIPEVGDFATTSVAVPPLTLQAVAGEVPFYSGERVLGITAEWYSTYESLPPQVGRIFMWNLVGGAYDYGGSCSGTVVGRDMVLTAGHCILPPNGDYFDAFTFYPDLYGTQAVYGYWTTTEAWIPTLYESYVIGGSTYQHVFDYGILKMDPNAVGQYPGDVITPFQVLMNTAGLELATYAMGYPADGWFGSQGYCFGGGALKCFPWYCSSTDVTAAHWGNGWYTMGYGCDASGGISGGPVFAIYSGQWYVISVNSHGSTYFQEPCYSQQISMTYCVNDFSYGRNLWGPEFRGGDGGIYGFDAFWEFVSSS